MITRTAGVTTECTATVLMKAFFSLCRETFWLGLNDQLPRQPESRQEPLQQPLPHPLHLKLLPNIPNFVKVRLTADSCHGEVCVQ